MTCIGTGFQAHVGLLDTAWLFGFFDLSVIVDIKYRYDTTAPQGRADYLGRRVRSYDECTCVRLPRLASKVLANCVLGMYWIGDCAGPRPRPITYYALYHDLYNPESTLQTLQT